MAVLDEEKLKKRSELLQLILSDDTQRLIALKRKEQQLDIIQNDCGHRVELSFTLIDTATDFTPNVKLTSGSSMNTPSSQMVNFCNESRYQPIIVCRLMSRISETNKGMNANENYNDLALVRLRRKVIFIQHQTENLVCDKTAPTWRYSADTLQMLEKGVSDVRIVYEYNTAPTWRYSADTLQMLEKGVSDMRFVYEYNGQTIIMYRNNHSVSITMNNGWCGYVVENSDRALRDANFLIMEPCEVSLKYRLVEGTRRGLDLCVPQSGMYLTHILPLVTESILFIESLQQTCFYYLEQVGPFRTDNLLTKNCEWTHDYVKGVDKNSIGQSKESRYGIKKFLTISKNMDKADVLIHSTIVNMNTRLNTDVTIWTLLEIFFKNYNDLHSKKWKCYFPPGLDVIFSTSTLNDEPYHILQAIKQHKRATKDVHVKTVGKYKANEYYFTMRHLWNMLNTIEYQDRPNNTITANLYDKYRKTKASCTKAGLRNVNVTQSVKCPENEYEANTCNDYDGGNFDGDSETYDSKTDVSNESVCSHKLQNVNSSEIEPNEMEIVNDSIEPRQDHNSFDEKNIDLTSQNVSSNGSSANGQNVDIVMESVSNRNIDQISNTQTGGCTLVQHAINAACRETHSAHVIDEMESTNNNNDVINHNRDDGNENESDDSLLDQTNESGISQDDHNNDNMARALQDELNIQDRAGYEHHLEYVDIRNPNADPPNHQYDSLVSIADSGFGSEHGHRGNVISDLNSVRNGRRVTRQNCPICRYRQTHGNMPRDQQLALYVPDEEGDTSLMLAITFTEIHLAKCLIEQAPSPQHLDIQNRYYLLTALHHAVIAERSDIIRYLLAHGADPTVKDKDGNTALHIACALATNENIILIKALTVSLSCGLEDFRYAHLHAIPQETTLFNYGGETVLHRAAEKGNTRAINFLIGPYFRINLNIQEATAGYTILHNAIIQTNRGLINHLLTLSDIDIEAETFAGQTPLELAEVYDLRDIVAMLIAYGARIRNVNVSDSADNDENLCQQPSSTPELVDAHREYGEVNSESTIKEQEVCSTGNVSSIIPNMITLTQADLIVDIGHSVKHTDTKTKTDHQAPKNGEQTTNVLDILHEEESEHILATSFDVHQNSVMECLNDRQGDTLSKSGNVVACNTPTHSTTHACEEEGDYDEDLDMLLISGMSVALRGQCDFW